MAILDDQLLGPAVPPNTLTGLMYRRFLFNDLPVLLEDVPVHQRQQMRFMPDGTSPHFRCTGRQHVIQTFSGQPIGSGGAANWSV